MFATAILSLVIGGAALYEETNLILPFEREELKLRGYLFYQDISQEENLSNPISVNRLEDPYEFSPSRLFVGEVEWGFPNAHISYYYSQIDIPDIGKFDFDGFHGRLEWPVLDDLVIYGGLAYVTRHSGGRPSRDDFNYTLGTRWRGISADWTFREISPVQRDDPFFQSHGFHIRATFRF